MHFPHRPCLAWLAVVTCFSPTSDNLAQISFVKGRTLERPSFLGQFYALLYFSTNLLLSIFLSPPSLAIPTHSHFFIRILGSALKHTIPWKDSCHHVQKRTGKLALELVPVRSKLDFENPSCLRLVSGGTCSPKTSLFLTFTFWRCLNFILVVYSEAPQSWQDWSDCCQPLIWALRF